MDEALSTPVASAEWVELQGPDRAAATAVEELMLCGNVLGEDGRYDGFTFIIATPKDLDRLKTAIVLREMAKVNDFGELLQLRNFRTGRRIVIPELDDAHDRIFLIDHVVAELFYKSDYYYSALQARLESAHQMLEAAMKSEGYR
jgi:hypothetical protein